MAIIFHYYKYDHKYIRIDEETFNKFVSMRIDEPNIELFYVKDINGLYMDLYNEFGKGVIILIIIGILLSAISNEGSAFFIPLVVWLIFGGALSIYNFIEDFYFYNNFNKNLNAEFNNFKNYNDYLNFVKFKKL